MRKRRLCAGGFALEALALRYEQRSKDEGAGQPEPARRGGCWVRALR